MACELVELEHFLKCLMYQDRDKDKIVKYVLCADTHISSKWERNAFI